MSQNHEKVLITTGITGGHFFPAVCFAEAYQRAYPSSEIWFVLGRKQAPFDLRPYQKKFRFELIPIDPFPKLFSLRMFPFLFNYLKSLFATGYFLRRLKPVVLISFGSYSSFPSVFLAWLFRIPVVIHEQNRVFGLANQVSSLFSKQVATSFPETLGRVEASKVKYTGYPIRQTLRFQKNSIDQNVPRRKILILGGSQGSHVLNEMIFHFFSQLSTEEKQKIAVIHITGEKDFDYVSKQYDHFKIDHEVYAFAHEIAQHYARAHLVIARAGAGTIFELAVSGLPGILVPYPFAFAHQFKNASYVAEQGGAVLIPENQLKTIDIKELVYGLLFDDRRREVMKKVIQRFDVPNATENLVEMVHGVIPSVDKIKNNNTQTK